MAKPKLVPATSAVLGAPERSKNRVAMDMTALALQASYEIEALAKLLSKQAQDQDTEPFVYVARGLGCRIKALNSIIMSAIGQSEIDENEVQEYERELYG